MAAAAIAAATCWIHIYAIKISIRRVWATITFASNVACISRTGIHINAMGAAARIPTNRSTNTALSYWRYWRRNNPRSAAAIGLAIAIPAPWVVGTAAVGWVDLINTPRPDNGLLAFSAEPAITAKDIKNIAA